MKRNLHEENRLSWNAATVAHNSHKGDQAAYFRNGGNKLYPEERALLGDIDGLHVVHLQCNAGQDTLSLAQLGASVTGVDISDTAIDFARRLSADSGVQAVFHRADVYDWLEETVHGTERFDIVFCSYGAICWLSDITLWAQGISKILKPGGRFVTVDYHPFWGVFDDDWANRFPYFANGQHQTSESGIGDYVAVSGDALAPAGYVDGVGVKDFKNPHPVHEFQWGIGEIVTALLKAGLALTALQEYPYSNGFGIAGMRETAGHRWIQPAGMPNLPLMYAIAAQKTEE